jgi:hypothetical protein
MSLVMAESQDGSKVLYSVKKDREKKVDFLFLKQTAEIANAFLTKHKARHLSTINSGFCSMG